MSGRGGNNQNKDRTTKHDIKHKANDFKLPENNKHASGEAKARTGSISPDVSICSTSQVNLKNKDGVQSPGNSASKRNKVAPMSPLHEEESPKSYTEADVMTAKAELDKIRNQVKLLKDEHKKIKDLLDVKKKKLTHLEERFAQEQGQSDTAKIQSDEGPKQIATAYITFCNTEWTAACHDMKSYDSSETFQFLHTILEAATSEARNMRDRYISAACSILDKLPDKLPETKKQASQITTKVSIVPLQLKSEIKRYLHEQGLEPASSRTVQDIYEHVRNQPKNSTVMTKLEKLLKKNSIKAFTTSAAIMTWTWSLQTPEMELLPEESGQLTFHSLKYGTTVLVKGSSLTSFADDKSANENALQTDESIKTKENTKTLNVEQSPESKDENLTKRSEEASTDRSATKLKNSVKSDRGNQSPKKHKNNKDKTEQRKSIAGKSKEPTSPKETKGEAPKIDPNEEYTKILASEDLEPNQNGRILKVGYQPNYVSVRRDAMIRTSAEIRQLMEEKDSMEKEENKLRTQIETLSAELKTKQQEIDQETTRIASEMNKKVSSDESNLENIGIQNRPMNIAGDYQMFCSQAWLDAKTDLDDMLEFNEQSASHLLFEILIIAEAEANSMYKEMLAQFKNFLNPESKNEEKGGLPEGLVVAVGDYLRSNASNIDIGPLSKITANRVRELGTKEKEKADKLWRKCQTKDNINSYVTESARLAWKMILQRPPMKFKTEGLNMKWSECNQSDVDVGWGSQPDHEDATLLYYVHPALYHGDKPMAKGKVLVHCTEEWKKTLEEEEAEKAERAKTVVDNTENNSSCCIIL